MAAKRTCRGAGTSSKRRKPSRLESWRADAAKQRFSHAGTPDCLSWRPRFREDYGERSLTAIAGPRIRNDAPFSRENRVESSMVVTHQAVCKGSDTVQLRARKWPCFWNEAGVTMENRHANAVIPIDSTTPSYCGVRLV